MKLKKWELALIFALAVTFLGGAAAAMGQKTQEELADKLIRLHVVAKSDTGADQALKLKVRDEILARVGPLLEGVTDREEAAGILEDKLGEITDAAKSVLQAEGCDDAVTASIEIEDFPTRDYETFRLPAGEYTALRVVIGDGAGQNWWCVVFPPLCVTAACDAKEVMKLLTDEEVKLITSDEPEYVIKFKSVEIAHQLKELLGLS